MQQNNLNIEEWRRETLAWCLQHGEGLDTWNTWKVELRMGSPFNKKWKHSHFYQVPSPVIIGSNLLNPAKWILNKLKVQSLSPGEEKVITLEQNNFLGKITWITKCFLICVKPSSSRHMVFCYLMCWVVGCSPCLLFALLYLLSKTNLSYRFSWFRVSFLLLNLPLVLFGYRKKAKFFKVALACFRKWYWRVN